MDTCTAIALYATETGYLIRGGLVLLAIGMIFAWRQGRRLRKTSLALQDSRRMAAGAQAKVRELEKLGADFEAELKRVDGERRQFKNALRDRQRKLEDAQDENDSLRQLFKHVRV